MYRQFTKSATTGTLQTAQQADTRLYGNRRGYGYCASIPLSPCIEPRAASADEVGRLRNVDSYWWVHNNHTARCSRTATTGLWDRYRLTQSAQVLSHHSMCQFLSEHVATSCLIPLANPLAC